MLPITILTSTVNCFGNGVLHFCNLEDLHAITDHGEIDVQKYFLTSQRSLLYIYIIQAECPTNFTDLATNTLSIMYALSSLMNPSYVSIRVTQVLISLWHEKFPRYK